MKDVITQDKILDNYYNKINELILNAKRNVRKNINYLQVTWFFLHIKNQLLGHYRGKVKYQIKK